MPFFQSEHMKSFGGYVLNSSQALWETSLFHRLEEMCIPSPEAVDWSGRVKRTYRWKYYLEYLLLEKQLCYTSLTFA